MARNEREQELEKENMVLRAELERLSSPPYLAGTVLDLGKKTARVSIDGVGISEVLSNDELAKKVKRGSRVVLCPQTKQIVSHSEFPMLPGEVVTVEEVVDGRLRVQNKGESLLVLSLLDEVKSGDEIALDSTGRVAIEKLGKRKTKYELEEVPDAPWETIGGLGPTIGRIKEEVEDPFIHKEIFARYGRKPVKGILLYGPPGCGKTMIAKSIAYSIAEATNKVKGKKGEKTNGHFIRVNGPEILDKYVGNSEANIRRIYQAARETAASNGHCPVVVFIDEAESVFKVRGSGISTDVYDSIVPQLLTEMDGMNGDYSIVTVLATNREDIIDPAVLRDGRVDRRIKVPRPDKSGAKEIFKIYLKGKPIQSGILTGPSLDSLAESQVAAIYDQPNLVYNVVSGSGEVMGSFSYQNLVSGAMIKGIVDRSTTLAIKREIAGGKKGISPQDLEQAVREEFSEHADFAQAFVEDDWETVFGSKGRQYYEASCKGYLHLEKTNGTAKQLKGGKEQ